MAGPVITFAHGTQTTTTSEADLWTPVIGDKYRKTYINLKNMLSGDTFVFKLYIWNEELGEYFEIQRVTKTDAQTPVGFSMGFDASTRYKLTVQKTAGTNRSITWLRADV